MENEIEKRGRLRYIINTEPHGDHWTGNAFFDVPVIAHEGVRTRILNTDMASHVARVANFGPQEPKLSAQGVLGYGLTSVIGAIAVEIFQGRHYAAIMGTLMPAVVGGGAVEPWAAGALHDATGSYDVAFWNAIGCSVLSAAAIWHAAAGRAHRRP